MLRRQYCTMSVADACLDSVIHGPELAARKRLTDLQQKQRIAKLGGPPLTGGQQASLCFLAVLYPPRPPTSPDEQSLAEHPLSSTSPC